MISIEERETVKIPGETSLFISFDYREDIVNLIKESGVCHYDKKTHVWEVPVTSLSNILDSMCKIDSIELKLLQDEEQDEFIEYTLDEFKTKPFNYQIEGIEYGLNHERWLLLDAPGLGKTLQIIYLAQMLKETRGVEHCLIVCGINTLKANWKKEIQKHSNLSCKILGEKTTKNNNVRIGSVSDRVDDLSKPIDEFFVITNIETLRNDKIIKSINNGVNNFDMIVVDEIHVCKSPTSQQGKNLLKLNKSKYRVGATGTLLLNNPVDSFVPLKWIGAERSTFTNFKYYYCIFGGHFNNMLVGYRNTDVLKDMIDKFSLRRKKDLLDLPPKTVIDEYVEMDSAQYNFYKNLENGIVSQVDLVTISATNFLSMISRLRQATACPKMLTSENIPSAKILRAVDLSKQIVENGDKVVIFSTFKGTLSYLYDELIEYNPTINTGDISDSEISKNIEDFQTSDKSKVFLATWQKMGTGVTLNAASYAIFIDTPWTSGQYLQTQDRVHRIGTNNNVFIYNLISKDTIDERVLDIVKDKEFISDYIVDDTITNNSLNSLKKYIEELQNT